MMKDKPKHLLKDKASKPEQPANPKAKANPFAKANPLKMKKKK
jgi:hypothetical protein